MSVFELLTSVTLGVAAGFALAVLERRRDLGVGRALAGGALGGIVGGLIGYAGVDGPVWGA